jgi:hypothetical protein
LAGTAQKLRDVALAAPLFQLCFALAIKVNADSGRSHFLD